MVPRWSSRFRVRNMMHSFGVKSRNTEKTGFRRISIVADLQVADAYDRL